MNGIYTKEFETWLAKKNNSKYAITCHSGTQALEIIAQYYITRDWDSRCHVLVPAITYPATINAFLRSGWDVTIVDTDAYGIMDRDHAMPELVNYNAIVLVGLYGAPIRNGWELMANIIIEDAAQHWLSDRGRRKGHAAAISFDPMKNLSCYGNGGAVITDDPKLHEYALGWRDNGKPGHTMTGSNSRMSEVDCATMMVKTKYIDQWQQRRSKIAGYWIEHFSKQNIRTLTDKSNYVDHCNHKFVVDIDSRNEVKKELMLRKIETKVHYELPLHEIPLYESIVGPGMFSKASALARRVLSLPIYPELTDLEVEYIADQLIDIVK
jgi:dTDP-4-amino-4,6-dideoxygalactose transaminase